MKESKNLAVVSLVLALFMLLSSVPVVAYAIDENFRELSKSKEATNLDANFESRVTLSLPAGDYKGDLDVVFVLDGSTSTDASDLAGSAAGLLEELTKFENLNVKAGLVIFGGSTPILYNGGLVPLTAESLSTITSVLTDQSYDGAAGRSGSNLQAGVKAAQSILNADSAVASTDKYMILLTDGGARMWVNDSGEAMSQAFIQYGGSSVSWGANQDFASRYIEEQNPRPLRTFDEVWAAGSTNEAFFARYALSHAESQQSDASGKAASWNTVCLDEDGAYYPSLEVATYYAATSIISAGNDAHVIWVDYPYHSDKYAEYTHSFKSWLADKGYITRYDSTASGKENIFADVKKQLTYLLNAGSYVVDYMGYVEGDYNLDFINKAETLTLTVGSTEKTVVDLGGNSYGFGNLLDSGRYEYELTYYPAVDGDEYFQWNINVPVIKDKPVKFAYTVKLINPKSGPDTCSYDLYTNNRATLTPVDFKGHKGASEDFKKPAVSYIVQPTNNTNIPKTGDNSHLMLWIALMAGSTVCLLLLFWKRRTEKGNVKS